MSDKEPEYIQIQRVVFDDFMPVIRTLTPSECEKLLSDALQRVIDGICHDEDRNGGLLSRGLLRTAKLHAILEGCAQSLIERRYFPAIQGPHFQ